MIEYEEERLLSLLWHVEGSCLFRAALFALPAAIVAPILVTSTDWSSSIHEEGGLARIKGSHLWSGMTVVLSLLLTFRTKQALARFWEGTGLLHQMRGEWFDSVSCCVTFSRSAAATKKEEVMAFRHTIVRLMSLCHGSALEEIADVGANKLATIDIVGLDSKTLLHLKESKAIHNFNRVEVILHLIQTVITEAHVVGVMKIPPPIMSRVYQTLSRGFVNLLNAKKITDTRFPFPLVQIITWLLMMDCVLTPIFMAATCPHPVWSFIFTFIPILGLASLTFIASELENPFGTDANDLPLTHFQEEMNRSLMMLLHGQADMVSGLGNRYVRDFNRLKCQMVLSDRTGSSSVIARGSISDKLQLFQNLNDMRSMSGLELKLDRDSYINVQDSNSVGVPGTPGGGTSIENMSLAAIVTHGGSTGGTGGASDTEVASNDAAASHGMGPGSSTGASGAPELPSKQGLLALQHRAGLEGALASTVGDFNTCLLKWTQTIEGQVTELNRSFEVLAQLSRAIEAQREAEAEGIKQGWLLSQAVPLNEAWV